MLYDIIPTHYDITRLYSWHHIHSIHDITPTVCKITYTLLVTSQPLYIWQDTYYVYDIIISIYDISNGVWMTTQTLYSMSWQPLCLWHHIHYIRCHTRCVYDNTGSISDLKPILSGLQDIISSLHDIKPPFLWHHTHYMWHRVHCHNMYDIIWTTYDITSTLYDITPLYGITSTVFFWLVCWWRREWQTTSVFLPWESLEQYIKKKVWYLKMNAQGQ